MRSNAVADRVGEAALRAVASANVESVVRSPLMGMGWQHSVSLGEKNPETGVSLRVVMRDGSEVRITVDVIGPTKVFASYDRRRSDLYKRRKSRA